MSVENKQVSSDINFSESPKNAGPPAVAHVTWTLEDRIQELDEILEGVSSLEVENQFRKFVEENIEPTGWQAIWRSSKETVGSAVASEEPLDFIVDVTNVNQEKLTASVLIKQITSSLDEDKSIVRQEIIGKNVSVFLSELFPTLQQENASIDICITAEVIEHLRFFYHHISLPWDNYEEICHYNKHVIRSRIKTYEDIQSGVIPRKICAEMEDIKNQGKKIAKGLVVLEERGNSFPDNEYDQFELVRLLKMSKQLNVLKERYETLKDPVLRELAAHEQQLERKHILTSSFGEEPPSNIHLVASSVEIEKFVQCISELPNVLNTLGQVLDFSKIRTYPSLQVALDVAHAYDCVVLLPGTHELKNLGSLSRGGTILGLGDGVEIVGCMEAGDVLLDVNVEPGCLLLLQSIVLKPILEQTAICVHTGKLLLNMCKLIGGTIGISLLEKTECKLKNSDVTNQEMFGLDMSGNAKLILDAANFENCQEAAVLLEGSSEVAILSDSYIIDCKIGIKYFVECVERPKSPGFHSNCNEDIESDKLIFRNVEQNFCRSTTKI